MIVCYQATREAVLGASNPFYFAGSAASGIGGPHVGQNYIWPMSLIIQALTATDSAEIKDCTSCTHAQTALTLSPFYSL